MAVTQDTDRVGGMIAIYELTDWWNKECSYRERSILIERNAMDGSDRLTQGEFPLRNRVSPARFLDSLGRQVSAEEYVNLGRKIYSKGDQLYSDNDRVLDRHYYLDGKASFYYRCRDLHRDNLKIALDTMRKLVSLAPKAAKAFREEWGKEGLPTHPGFHHLAVLYENDKQYEIAIRLCEAAKQQGWKGDWDRRIERCVKKLDRVVE